ncbi:MAG TPA: D-alanyl-D-alanine carboxypeptidase/D-alanyl-D-alanine-endopeptidase [Ilumatobacter sp.]|nr:D-alanyl-D-alanine carboxypeptidase/D-alanyl-D-alanine-endopeptidase [Ilumatobacter sp.]
MALLFVIAALPAFALAGTWQYADANVPAPVTTTTTTVPPAPEPELTTQILSFRRHPEPIASKVAQAAAANEFAALAQSMTGDLANGSCLQVVSGGAVIAEFEPATPVIPASNQKLLVAAVALALLGPEYRFTTELFGPAPVDGVITGDVYLVGGGDPLLVSGLVPDPQRYPAFNTTSVVALADQLVAQGVVRIDGELVGDGSRYDDEFRVPSWGDDITSAEAGPYDALLIDDGQITAGNYGLEPNRAAARVFVDLLVARGVPVSLGPANRTRPADVPEAPLVSLGAVQSVPLRDVIVELLHTSDDNTAELLLKEIGYAATGVGTRQAGIDTVYGTLIEWGMPMQGVMLADGSGLSRDNRLTCATLVGLLTSAPVSAELVAAMPVAARDGTMREQLLGTPADGVLSAKTGSLTGVKALSGQMRDRTQRSVVFALVLNGDGVNDPVVYEPAWIRLVQQIAELPVGVDPDVSLFAPR